MSRKTEENFRQARAALRLQRAVLPGVAVQLLADEVVVQLARRLSPADTVAVPDTSVAVDAFCEALISDDTEAAINMIRQQRRNGAARETIYLVTLASAARRLGELWEKDALSFLQVSAAAGRIFDIMRHLRQESVPTLPIADAKHALFATVPGELHTLGVTMAADLFRDRGWEIDLRTSYEHEELVSVISTRTYRIIGLSAGDISSVLPLTRLVVALRITQPQAHIVVAGNIVNKVPDLNALIRADTILSSGDDAVALLDRLSAQAA
jgi:methanogenic corrinoid protein MtbC1